MLQELVRVRVAEHIVLKYDQPHAGQLHTACLVVIAGAAVETLGADGDQISALFFIEVIEAGILPVSVRAEGSRALAVFDSVFQ